MYDIHADKAPSSRKQHEQHPQKPTWAAITPQIDFPVFLLIEMESSDVQLLCLTSVPQAYYASEIHLL